MQDAGFVEKMEPFVSEGVDIVHIGLCGGRTEETACPGMAKMAAAFREYLSVHPELELSGSLKDEISRALVGIATDFMPEANAQATA